MCNKFPIKQMLKWHGDNFEQYLKGVVAEKIERACIVVKNEAKISISEPSNHGITPSDPGQQPHKDTGRLRASVSHEVDKATLTGRVGTNVDYGKFLELGTVKMAARPWLRPALEKMRSTVIKILQGK